MRRSVKSCLRITKRSADRGNFVGREGVRTIRRHAVSRHRAQGGPNRAVMCIIMKDRGVVIPEGEEMILPPPGTSRRGLRVMGKSVRAWR